MTFAKAGHGTGDGRRATGYGQNEKAYLCLAQ